jgi:hypothetical protein
VTKKHPPSANDTSHLDASQQGFNETRDGDEKERNTGHLLITDLVDSLNRLETIAPTAPPALAQFRRLVEDTRAHERQRLRRDVSLFLVVALCVAISWLLGMRFTPRTFIDFLIAASALSVIGTPVGLVMRRGRKEVSR